MFSMAAVKAALSIALSKLPFARKLNAERIAGKNPETAQDSHTDRLLDGALKRLGAADASDPFWTKALTATASVIVRPESFSKPHVREWLSSKKISNTLKKLAASKIISADEIASDRDFLIDSYMDTSGENQALAVDMVFTAVTFLSASIQADIRDPGTAALIQVGFSSIQHQLSTLSMELKGDKEEASSAGIRAMYEHSNIVFKRVSDNGAKGLVFARSDLDKTLDEASTSAKVILIAGAAGSGKSVLAKKYVLSKSQTNEVIAFAAEELKFPHIDQVLANSQVKLTWIALVDAQKPGAKICFIDGLERLLEGEERGAFIDLINTAIDNPDIKLFITCRDYHVDTVEQSLLARTGVSYKRVIVPPLNNFELDEAKNSFPHLLPLLNNPSLRALLRSPFILARVAETNWPQGQPLPKTERALREHLWNQVVKRSEQAKDGLPNRRAVTLTEISLTRAKSLQPYVESIKDIIALNALAVDSLIVVDSSGQRFAPAHDVFEDWALIEWINNQFVKNEGNAHQLTDAIDSYPALRRAYRKWLHEMLETNPDETTDFLTQVTTDADIAEHFKDDTLISVFQSSQAENFLDAFGKFLFTDNAILLKRAINLVRVACKTVSPLVARDKNTHVSFRIPTGSAWPTLIEFLIKRWDDYPSNSYSLVLSLVEDWSSGINWITPYPPGAEAAGQLVEKLLPVVRGGYGRETEKQRAIELLIKFPKSADSLFKNLVTRALTLKSDDDDAETFIKALLKPWRSFAVCRDYPNETIALFTEFWKKDEKEDDDLGIFGRPSSYNSIESAFGINETYQYRLSNPSADQGPFLFLLRAHPSRAIRYITELVNEATVHYSEASKNNDYLDPLETVLLTFANGSSREIYCNGKLWVAYRGNSVMPGVLQCALMALEKWLLELGVIPRVQPFLRTTLEWLLDNTNNAALVSVVASVCIAQPKTSGDAALSVLGCRDFFALDIARCTNENFSLAMGGFSAEDKHLQQERLASNRLPHRAKHLEDLALNLQLTDKREDVFKILDRHKAELPAPDLQENDDKVWRLSMSRMDQREYEVRNITDDGMIQLGMKPLEKDIQLVIDEAAPRNLRFLEHISLSNWSNQQFNRNPQYQEEAKEWPKRLADAQQILMEFPEGLDGNGFLQEAPNVIAAICIRDYWEEMVDTDREWCLDTVSNLIEKPLLGDNSIELHAKHPSNGSGSCATVLALIASRDMENASTIHSLMNGLLHFNETVRLATLEGVATHVIGRNAGLTKLCLNILIQQKNRWHEIIKIESKKPWNARGGMVSHWRYVLSHVRADVNRKWFEGMPDFNGLRFYEMPDQQLVAALIKIYHASPSENLAIVVFSQIAADLAKKWGMTRKERRNHEEKKNYEFEFDCEHTLSDFLVRCDSKQATLIITPIINEVKRGPKEGAKLLLSLIISYDKQGGLSTFWDVWKEFAIAIRESAWLEDVDTERTGSRELLSHSFFNIDWHEGVRTWSKLDKHSADIDDHFLKCKKSSFLLGCYAEYLFKIGKNSLPGALVLITNKYGGGLGEALVTDTNICWHLDAILSRLLFEDLHRLKKTEKIRVAVIGILDALVYAGSSVAFQLRDDFVTPHTAVVSMESLKEV